MSVIVQCPSCAKKYEVPDDKVGAQAQCKGCGESFTLSIRMDQTRVPVAKRLADPKPSAGPQALPHRTIGPYSIKRQLGAGAMGEVYLGYDATLAREVAVKILPASVAEDKELLERFLHEARSVARLNHTNAVSVYQAGVHEGRPYIALELVDGESLDKTVAGGGPLDWRSATRAIRDAAAGLAAAHELGLIHRDVKPANLMRNTKRVTKVVDFGLARDLTSGHQLTQPGTLLGTPAFMAPEQWQHHPVDARTDLYALACTYYFLLTGEPPFSAPTIVQLAYQHRTEPFSDPRLITLQIPDAVCRVLIRGSSKAPGDRYQSAGDLATELDALLARPEQTLTFDEPWDSLLIAGAAPLLPPPASNVPLVLANQAQATTIQRASSAGAPSAIISPVLARRKPKPPSAALYAGCAAVLTILLAVVIYIATNNGTVKITLSDPQANVEVLVDGNKVGVKALDAPLKLRVGKHILKISGRDVGNVNKSFTVQRGDNQVLPVELLPRQKDIASTNVATPPNDLKSGTNFEPALAGEDTPFTHSNMATAVEFSSDGGLLATAGNDGLIKIWEFETGKLKHTFTHGSDISGIALNSDATILASWGKRTPRHAKFWKMKTQEEYDVFGELRPQGPVAFCRRGPTIAFVVGKEFNSVLLWNLDSGSQTGLLQDHAGDVRALRFTSDGKMLASGGVDRRVVIWDVPKRSVIHRVELRSNNGAFDTAGSMRFTSDDKVLFTGGLDTTAWDVKTGTVLWKKQVNFWTSHLAVSPNDEIVASTGAEGPTSVQFNLVEGGAQLEPLKGIATANCMAFSPDGRYLVTAGPDQKVRVWNIKDRMRRPG